MLAKYYIDILNISKESADAKKLLNFRAPHTAKQVAYSISQANVKIMNHILRHLHYI